MKEANNIIGFFFFFPSSFLALLVAVVGSYAATPVLGQQPTAPPLRPELQARDLFLLDSVSSSLSASFQSRLDLASSSILNLQASLQAAQGSVVTLGRSADAAIASAHQAANAAIQSASSLVAQVEVYTTNGITTTVTEFGPATTGQPTPTAAVNQAASQAPSSSSSSSSSSSATSCSAPGAAVSIVGIILGGFSLFAVIFVFISWRRRPRSRPDKREPDYNTPDSDLWFKLNLSLKPNPREKARDKRHIGWPMPWRRAHRSALSNSASESPNPNPTTTRPRGYTDPVWASDPSGLLGPSEDPSTPSPTYSRGTLARRNTAQIPPLGGISQQPGGLMPRAGAASLAGARRGTTTTTNMTIKIGYDASNDEKEDPRYTIASDYSGTSDSDRAASNGTQSMVREYHNFVSQMAPPTRANTDPLPPGRLQERRIR